MILPTDNLPILEKQIKDFNKKLNTEVDILSHNSTFIEYEDDYNNKFYIEYTDINLKVKYPKITGWKLLGFISFPMGDVNTVLSIYNLYNLYSKDLDDKVLDTIYEKALSLYGPFTGPTLYILQKEADNSLQFLRKEDMNKLFGRDMTKFLNYYNFIFNISDEIVMAKDKGIGDYKIAKTIFYDIKTLLVYAMKVYMEYKSPFDNIGTTFSITYKDFSLELDKFIESKTNLLKNCSDLNLQDAMVVYSTILANKGIAQNLIDAKNRGFCSEINFYDIYRLISRLFCEPKSDYTKIPYFNADGYYKKYTNEYVSNVGNAVRMSLTLVEIKSMEKNGSKFNIFIFCDEHLRKITSYSLGEIFNTITIFPDVGDTFEVNAIIKAHKVYGGLRYTHIGIIAG